MHMYVKLAAASLLAESVRDFLHEPSHASSLFAFETLDDDVRTCTRTTRNTTSLPIGVTAHRPFDFEGIKYPTVQHAFQAQKLPLKERQVASTLDLSHVCLRERHADIDVASWDANKDTLMYELLKTQVTMHDDMRDSPKACKDNAVVVDDLFDAYWPAVLPELYRKLGDHFLPER